jgi:pimeloyl-ACP methyl ester carboxylesterase
VEAVYLELDPDVVAMLHQGPAAAQSTAVLICPPFGWQEQASYRSVRTWANLLARAGFTTARLTLPAAGDSGGMPADPHLLDTWTSAVGGAASWLRERTGCARVLAIGIGLGGMLAWRAAAQGAAIDDFALWAVPDSGRRLLRELRTQSRLVAQAEAPGEAPAQSASGESLIGFRMTEETAQAVGDLRLSELVVGEAGSRRALLISRGALAVDSRLRGHLEALGVAVQIADGEEFDALMANPQQSVAPVATAETIVQWLSKAPPASGAPGGSRHVVRERGALRAAAGAVHESALTLRGEHGELYAVASRPASGTPSSTAIVFLGGGALPHPGPSRNWVEIGRRWAARGIPSVRLDLGGIGESDGDDPELLTNVSFSAPWRAREARTILDQLVERGIATRFILGGLCSGANVAMQTALLDDRVDGILLLNMFAFEFTEALVAERGRRLQIEQGLPGARARQLDRDLLVAAMNYVRPDRAWRLLRRAEERAELVRARTTFDRLRDRRVQTLLLLGRYEPMTAQFERHGMFDQLDRWPNLTLERLSTRDHMLRDLSIQREVMTTVDRLIGRVVGSGASLNGDAGSGGRLERSAALD